MLDDVFVAGDVARWPLPLYGDQFIAVEHWDNAVKQGETAAYNMLRPGDRRPHNALPAFWSIAVRGQHQVARDRLRRRRDRRHPGLAGIAQFVAVYGRRGRIVAAVAFNGAALAAVISGDDRGAGAVPAAVARRRCAGGHASVPAGFPPRSQPTHSPTAERTGPPPMDPRLPPQHVHAAPWPPGSRVTKGLQRLRNPRSSSRSSPTPTAPIRTRSTPSCARLRSRCRMASASSSARHDLIARSSLIPASAPMSRRPGAGHRAVGLRQEPAPRARLPLPRPAGARPSAALTMKHFGPPGRSGPSRRHATGHHPSSTTCSTRSATRAVRRRRRSGLPAAGHGHLRAARRAA